MYCGRVAVEGYETQTHEDVMHTQIENVTPSLAAAWLERNTSNRPLRISRVEAHVEAMKRGEWKFNGDPIRFAIDGTLLDGQHRLSAVVKSGIAQKFVVINGLPSDVFSTIDIGSNRGASDILALSGMKHTTSMASGARMFMYWKRNGNPATPATRHQATNTQILEFCKDNELMHRATSYVCNNKFITKFMSASIGIFIYMAISEKSESLAVDFLDAVSAREISTKRDASLLLREKLLEMAGSRNRVSRPYKTAIVMKAFRLWQSGKTPKLLSVKNGPELQEANMYSIGN